MDFVFKKSLNGRKRAGITIEVMLAAALALIVLFMILGLFSNNLKKMFEGGSINNMFTNNQSTSTFDKDYGYKATSSQDNGAVGDQALAMQKIEDYRAEAVSKINYYAGLKSLTNEQRLDLAKYLTIFGEAAEIPSTAAGQNSISAFQDTALYKTSVTTDGHNNGKSYQTLANDNGITFNWAQGTNSLTKVIQPDGSINRTYWGNDYTKLDANTLATNRALNLDYIDTHWGK